MSSGDWPEIRQGYDMRYKKINDYVQNKLKGDSEKLATAVASYVKTGGGIDISGNDPVYNNIIEISKRINDHKRAMAKLNSEITESLQSLSTGADMGSILLENGQLQQEIIRLEKEQDEIREDVETAKERSMVYRDQATDISKYQIFFLGRPLRPGIIPWLWSLSILFIGVALLLLYYGMLGSFGLTGIFAPIQSDNMLMTNSNNTLMGRLWVIVMNPAVWGTLFGATVIVIIFLSLKIAGYFN